MRPAREKALIINAFALAGRFAIFNPYTQGAALGYLLLGLSARFVLTFDTLSFLNYLSLKVIGTLYFTFTGLPFCLPGSHAGITFTTRIASSSSTA